jgi:hypothetical protein
MWQLYLKKYESDVDIESGEKPLLKYQKYLELFTDTGFAFGQPKTDTCSVCDELRLEIQLGGDGLEVAHYAPGILSNLTELCPYISYVCLGGKEQTPEAFERC